MEQIVKQKAKEDRFFRVLFILLTLFVCVLSSINTHAQKPGSKHFNNVNTEGIILDGYDAVAFFTDSKPVKGDPKFRVTYEEAVYQFASQEHLDLFKANPGKYKPQFGGWCAYAVSLGRVAPIDVNTFSIVDGRLFIQHNQRAVNGWNKDVPGNVVKADKYWPSVSEKNGKQITTDEEKGFLNNTDPDGVTLQGYDAVAYFTEMKAVKGDPKYSARYNGATYWFSSEAHAGMFKDHPEIFAPRYGAFCGYAMALNKLRPINPEIFDVIDGKLILQHSQDAYTQFHKNITGTITKANDNWPGQVKKHAGKKVKFDKPAKPADPENAVADKSAAQVSKMVKKSFKEQYPDVAAVSWRKSADVYLADFSFDGKRILAYYDETGVLIGSGVYINTDQLPSPVYNAVNAKYGNVKVKTIVEYFSQETGLNYYLHITTASASRIIKADTRGNTEVIKNS